MNRWSRKEGIKGGLPSFLRAWLLNGNQRLHGLARLLQQRSNRYSVRKKKVLLAVFLVFFLGESSFIIVEGLIRPHKTIMEVSRIKTLPLEQDPKVFPWVTKSDFERIQVFKYQIDSLGTTAEGRKIRDSLLRGRPHLMDSVNFLAELYLEQSKNH